MLFFLVFSGGSIENNRIFFIEYVRSFIYYCYLFYSFNYVLTYLFCIKFNFWNCFFCNYKYNYCSHCFVILSIIIVRIVIIVGYFFFFFFEGIREQSLCQMLAALNNNCISMVTNLVSRIIVYHVMITIRVIVPAHFYFNA